MSKPLLLVKVGGGNSINWDEVSRDLHVLREKYRILVVHGGNGLRDALAKKLGSHVKRITSPSGIPSVYTDEEARDVLLMAYPGIANSKIVAKCISAGVPAVGLSGIDGTLWSAKRKTAVYAVEDGKTKLITDNLTGKVQSINTDLLLTLLDNGYVPVMCTPAVDETGEILNVDNDWAVACMVRDLHIQQVVFLFEARGFLKDATDETSVYEQLTLKDIERVMEFAKGGMKKKLIAVSHMLTHTKPTIIFADGRVSEPISNALDYHGTTITHT